MYLKEIVISGFKSFADRTRLDLGPWSDRGGRAEWVWQEQHCRRDCWCREQSAKALRGASIQDVIFEGTDKRRGSTCEVALTFTDCEADLGTQFNEVEISRRSLGMEGAIITSMERSRG